MKKITILIVALCFAHLAVSQVLSYNDIGVLFSKEQVNGTARYNAMSGAFGALGGDLSSIDINPAGNSVFINSEFSITVGLRNSYVNSSYYQQKTVSENDYSDVSQLGGVLVFRTSRRSKGWNKMALSFNRTVLNDFSEQWIAKGNSNNPTFVKHPDNEKITYHESNGQSFESYKNGGIQKYSFGLSTKYNNDLFLGVSLNSYDVNYSQRSNLVENNYNSAGGTLDASLRKELRVLGDGVSLSFGVIAKPIKSIRLGLAYHSPVWNNLKEEFIEEDSEIIIDKREAIKSKSGLKAFEYVFRAPDKLVGSVAYVINKLGLISVDYIHKNYSNALYQSADFSKENQNFKKTLQSVGELRIGTEWNLNRFSFRGGYHYDPSPYKNAQASDDLSEFSLGAGYKFRGGRIDVSYQQSMQGAPYNFYPRYDDLQSAELEHNNSKITATLVLNL